MSIIKERLMQESKKLKNFNWAFYFSVFLMFIVPTIYNTFKINIISGIPDTMGLDIASQFAWLDIMYEVIEEGMILPLFYILGSSISSVDVFSNRVKKGSIVVLIVYSIMSAIVFLNVERIAVFMQVPSNIFNQSVEYIRMEVVALVFSVLYLFFKTTVVLVGKWRYVATLVVVQLISGVLLDNLFFGSLFFSLGFGVNGIAISRLIQRLITIALSIFFLNKEGLLKKSTNKQEDTDSISVWGKKWLKIGSISALESFVRNLIFAVVILRMINVVQEQGNFWVMMAFIWGWLLAPVLSLGEVIKRNVGVDNSSVSQQFKLGFVIISIISLIWLITIPIWSESIRILFGVSDYQLIFRLSLLSIGFYIIKAYNHVVDSIFYGLGRTDLMLYQSLATNIVFYGFAYSLYILNIWTPTVYTITILFGLGMAFDSIITFTMYIYLSKNNKLKAF